MVGPLFVSIGDEEKLATFLNVNPEIPKDCLFVDDYKTFDVYNALELDQMGGVDYKPPKDIELSTPQLGGFQRWWSYLTNVMQLSPIPKEGVTFGTIPEGVLRLGGTFVVSGEDVIFEWIDGIPGDHPDKDQVLTMLGVDTCGMSL